MNGEMSDAQIDVRWPRKARSHKSRDVVLEKLARIDEAHIRPLNDLVRRMRYERGGGPVVPWFDPHGGGIYSRVLFLLEAPGRMADAGRGSGFISPDNHDGTARNLFELREHVGLRRDFIAHWNIVPWYLPDGKRTRATARKDVLEAGPWLGEVLRLLSDLRLVVTMGKHAAAGWERWCSENQEGEAVARIQVPHPSATNLNTHPGAREEILEAMRTAASVASSRA